MGPNDLLHLPTLPDGRLPDGRLKEEVACDRSGHSSPAPVASGSGN
jgi:hypothetical protein